MSANPRTELARAEKSFLNSQGKTGIAKKKVYHSRMGRPTKDAIIQQALRDNSLAFFKRVLDDETEEKLWKMFITGKAEQLDERGHVVKDAEGNPFFVEIELNPISFNAFKQMVAYKRGLPAIKVEQKNPGDAITVNFNVMGVPANQMEKRVRELGLLSVPSEV